MLTLSKARRIVRGAILQARELGVNISVAVCDSRGQLIALNRMDGAVIWDADRGAIGKAVAAAMIGRPSGELAEHLPVNGRYLTSCSGQIGPRGQRGGLPIIQEGVVAGGCGVSGAHTFDQDEECARAGIITLGSGWLDQPLDSSLRQVSA